MPKRKPRKAKPDAPKPEKAGRENLKTERVASPWNNGFDRIQRVVDTITVMHRRKQLDQRQHDAAQRYRFAFEACHGAVRSSLNVDNFTPGAPGSRTPSSPLLMAAEILNETRRLLGAIDGLVVEMVAGQGCSIEEATARMCGRDKDGRCREGDLRTIGSRLREALNLLAYRWFGPDRRAKHDAFVPEWGRPGVLTRWGEVERAKAAHS